MDDQTSEDDLASKQRETIMSGAKCVFIILLCTTCFALSLPAAEPASALSLSGAERAKCLTILREGLASDEFWPAMHAAEGLSRAGLGAEVQKTLQPRVATETDDQRRCGLARELVRAGDLAHTQIMLDILASDDPFGHTHACESLFKVWQLGDGALMRKAMTDSQSPKKMLMAAAALARWGSPAAFELLRKHVRDDDGETARIAAWILARVGDASDVEALRSGAERFSDPLTRAYFEHALASLGDESGRAALIRNLGHEDPSVRVYACEFAPDARVAAAKNGLLRLLDDSVFDIRIRAADALLALSQPAPFDRNEIVVRDVFPATSQNPRYSEGSIIALRDGRLLYATTEFIGDESDFASAQIVAVESRDGGRTWTDRRVLQENVGQKNVMSATLRRLSHPTRYDAPIGFFYLVKNSLSELRVYLRVSRDEGRTFSDPILVTDAPGYHVLNNDRVMVLSSGRIVVPVSSTEDVGRVNHFVCSTFTSDDGGRTWQRSRNTVDYARRGAMEPEVLELGDGSLLMHFRTQLGHIAVSESSDGGQSWSEARSWNVRAPEAPATLRRIPSTGDLLLIWNDAYTPGAGHGGKRTPLTAAISSDEGRTWTRKRQLETDPDHTYAYTSVAFFQGRALLTYYVRDEKSGRISSRFRSLPLAWLYHSD
jgi:sialidase-1